VKSAAFEYLRPSDLAEACAMLAQEDDARLIAGGQTLVPLMAMRLARPKRLIDIARLVDLAFVRKDDGQVAIGATTKQCVVECDSLVRADVPLLAKVIPFVGHAAIRARGTLGGSLANGDPAAEIALVAVTLGATLVYREEDATSEIPASAFFTGPMMTALPPTACLTSVRFPVWNEAQVGVGFHEVNARQSDFAFASAAAQIVVDEADTCRRLALGIGAVTPVPLCLDQLAQALIGTRIEEKKLRKLARAALAEIEPLADLHASAQYRRRAAATLIVRAVMDANRSAQAEPSRAH
jgi:CO/xanthine dehydrogenase FAD-binding subunit